MLDKVDKIKTNCKPFSVSVHMTKQKDRYYLKLALSPQLHNNDWLDKWGGFHQFAKFQVEPMFPHADLTSTTGTSATFFIGKFFDILKGK